jgi:hypothetical protein
MKWLERGSYAQNQRERYAGIGGERCSLSCFHMLQEVASWSRLGVVVSPAI